MRGEPQSRGPRYAADYARRTMRALRGGDMDDGERWGRGERMALLLFASDRPEGRSS